MSDEVVPTPSPSPMYIAKLASSTLTLADAEVLGFIENQIGAVSAWPSNPSFTIPYYHPVTGAPLTDNPAWAACPPYYRHRVLGTIAHAPGPADLTRKRDAKYLCASGTAPCAYYPRLIDWAGVVDDTSSPVIITEGELKAAAACKAGFPTIGLGGVASWRSKSHGYAWLPSLDLVDWRRRRVYICFDADYRTNASVARELQALTDALTARGAICLLLVLPDLPDVDKVGLDDFLVHHGAAGPDMLMHLLEQAERLGYAGELFRLNREYAVVRSTGNIVRLADGTLIPVDVFKVAEGTRTVLERRMGKPGKDGSGAVIPAKLEPRSVVLAPEWLTWVPRNTVGSVVYEPGMERITAGGDYNSWPGWGCKPAEGDVSIFIDFFTYVTRACTDAQRLWLLRWFAYPLQVPGTKHYTAVVAYGPQGSGKGLLGDTIGRIYGSNYLVVEKDTLSSAFNSWQTGKQFIVGDELSGHDKRGDAERLKKLITQTEILVNEKYVKAYRIRDTINYYFTSNHGNALFLEDSDRRYFVLELKGPIPDLAYFSRYDKWFKSEEGISALFHFLLSIDLGDFNPLHPAPLTEAKELMRESGRSDVSAWVHDLLADPDTHLRVGDAPLVADVYSAHELLPLYTCGERSNVTAGGIGRELAAAGAARAHGGGLIQSVKVRRDRYWIIRNKEKWINASHAEIVAHLTECHGPIREKKF